MPAQPITPEELAGFVLLHQVDTDTTDDNENPDARLWYNSTTGQFIFTNNDDTQALATGSVSDLQTQTVKIGDIGFADINAAAAAASIAIALPTGSLDSIPASAQVTGIYVSMKATFASATRDLDTLNILDENGANALVAAPIDAANLAIVQDMFMEPADLMIRFAAAQGADAVFTFAGGMANPQDYTAGDMDIYASYVFFPTLT